jgi:hypothetical protein
LPRPQDYVLEQNDFDGFTEEREVEWELYRIHEVWRGGEVVGYVGESSATVSFWDASDPDDPTSVSFDAYVFADAELGRVRVLVDGP